jgi:predicted RNA methylase
VKIDSDQNSSVDELRRRVEATEQNPSRRARLFQKFGGPRAAIIERLTEAILTFIAEERSALNGATVLDYGCGVMPYVAAFRIVGARVILMQRCALRMMEDCRFQKIVSIT